MRQTKNRELYGMRKAMMFSALFFCGVAILSSCRKTGELTPENQEGALNANFTDTLTIQSLTILDNELRTDLTSRSLFGVYNDEIFGKTTGSSYVQFNLSTAQLQFPSGTSIDSVVLKIAFDNVFGNEEYVHKMNVYELSEAFEEEGEYFNTSTLAFNSTAIGTASFVPDLTDSTSSDTSITGPHISIPLDISIGQRILDHGLFEDNADFVDLFKGIHCENDPSTDPAIGDGNLTYLNFISENTKMFVYYTFPSDDGSQISEKYEFLVGTSTPRFTNYTHDFTNSPVIDQLDQTGLEENYVKPLGGLKTKIMLPNLQNIAANGSVVINKAELILTIAEGSDDELVPPSRLVLLTQDEDGENVFLTDFFEGTDYYGGEYDINSGTYKFNIARHINELLNENKVDRGLFLFVSGSSVNANRLILQSGSASENKMLLNLTYTQL